MALDAAHRRRSAGQTLGSNVRKTVWYGTPYASQKAPLRRNRRREQFGSITKDAEAPFSSGARLPGGCVLDKNNCPWSNLDKYIAPQEA